MDNFNLLQYAIILLKKKKLLIINFILVCIVAFVYAFYFARVQFASTVTFLPPVSESRGISSFLSGFDLAGVFGSDIMPEQIVTVFNSHSIRRKIIDEFNLYEKYKLKDKPGRFKLALKQIAKDIEMETDEVGRMGITKFVSYSMRTYHESPDTAYLMVNFAFHLIDSVVKEVSADRGYRDRLFVEKQIELNKKVLDSLQQEFKQFQIENKAYNVPEQVSAALKSYGQLRASLLAGEIQLQRLKRDYNSNYPAIESLKKTNRVLRQKLHALEKLENPDIMVGLEMSTELAPRYANYMRDIEVQNELLLLLSEELEQAKLKEARDVSQLKIVDPPYVPRYKSRPKRSILAALIVFIYMSFLACFIVAQHLYATRFKDSRVFNEIIGALRSRK